MTVKIDEDALYHRTLKVWGKERQMLQVIEEMSELAKEILKNVNCKKDNIKELIEETADVEIMIGQLKICCEISEQVAAYKADKLKMIEQRLVEWEKKDNG